VLTPPLAGEAIQMLAAAQTTSAQPPERTLLAPSSFPPLAELKRVRAASAGKT